MAADRSPLSRRVFLTGAGVGAGAAVLALAAADAASGATAPVTFRPERTESQAPARVGTSRAMAISESPRAGVGFSVNSGILWESEESQKKSLDLIVALGATSIRLDLPWRWLEPTRGAYSWELTDRVISEAVARNLSVLGVLTGTPQWAALNGSDNAQTRPASLQDWAQWVSTVTAYYADRVGAFEVWNEPNARMYFAPNPDPAFYGQMVAAAVTAIRSSAPGATVVAGALGPTNTSAAEGNMHAVEFFDVMMANGAGAADAFSFHPYDHEQSFADGGRWDGAPARQVLTMRERLDAAGHGAKKIWATEYGAPSTLGEERQSQLVAGGITQWAEIPTAGPMFIHHHKDQAPDDFYGVMTADHAFKPAAYGVEWMTSNGIPPRWEADSFDGNIDPALGAYVSPVYAIGAGYGRDAQSGVRFVTPGGWFSSPKPVAAIVRPSGLLPTGAFVDGMQSVGTALRIFYKSSTGAWLVQGGILAAWVPKLGFPTGNQYVTGWFIKATVQQFEFGRIEWKRGRASVIYKKR
ncbi:cellulase family glycosylhydrolase [Microbacterium sp.]|uniref:cellulase family glycosylhydrolase n=1 Tax=Microbacterium sp. TaxID=51671 RepID=UPI0025ECBF67|nr:cellulase family glycosylhydrolase [Microbacterium sp.]